MDNHHFWFLCGTLILNSIFAETANPANAEAEWKKIQKNTFTRWSNEHLKEDGLYIYNLETDLGDGLKLIALLENLSHQSIQRYNRKPIFKPQKIENIAIALKFIEEQNIKLVNKDALDVFQGNLKLIQGLIWTLILKYQISLSMLGDSLQHLTPKAALKYWVNSKLPYEMAVDNFKTDWDDGIVLACLLEATAPGLFPNCTELSPENKLENANEVMELAEEWLGIPQVITPEEITNPNVDELSVMTYVSYLPDATFNEP